MYHIYFLSPHSDPQADIGEPDSGGQCIYEHELGIALSQLPDFKVTTFCRQNYVRPDHSIINNSYEIRRIEAGPKERVLKENLEVYLPEFCQKVEQEILSLPLEETPIFHGHYWDGGFAALVLKQRSQHKLPFVWTPHSLGTIKRMKFNGENNELKYNFIPRVTWESYSVALADAIILSTEKEKNFLIEDYGAREEKVKVIPPGVAIDVPAEKKVDEWKDKYGVPKTGKILLCLGRMVPTKGYHHAIGTFAELRKKYSEPIYLVIAGGSANPTSAEEIEYRKLLKQRVEEFGLQDNVIFLPSVDHAHIHEVFSVADIFLMTSENEPFGLVTIEAMASRVPVIAANSGGSLNIISHNQTGILVDFHDYPRAASYILSLLKDTELYEKVCTQAYKYMKKTYDWKQKAEQFAQVYRQVSRHSELDNFQTFFEKQYFLQNYFGG